MRREYKHFTFATSQIQVAIYYDKHNSDETLLILLF